MKYVVQRSFGNIDRECLGWTYQNFADMLKNLIYDMRDRIGHPFSGDEYHNLRFVMDIPLHNEFYTACKMSGHDSDTYRGIKIEITKDPILPTVNGHFPDGIVKLVYYEDESGIKHHPYYSSVPKLPCDFWKTMATPFKANPHIDHVKFNGPATIVFWKDGTKTVVKHDGKGRKDKRLAILYAFIRKIYGEGKSYHNILNEIEEAIK